MKYVKQNDTVDTQGQIYKWKDLTKPMSHVFECSPFMPTIEYTNDLARVLIPTIR